MKKKLLLSVLTLFVASLFAVNVNAQTTMLGIPFGDASKTPVNVPSTNSKMGAINSEPFDFSRIQFAVNGSTCEIYGANTSSGPTSTVQNCMFGEGMLKKIILTDLEEELKPAGVTALFTGGYTQDSDPKSVLGNWFTGYCLDAEKKYPFYGLLSNPVNINASNLDQSVQFINELGAWMADHQDVTAAKNVLRFMLQAVITNNKDLYNAYLSDNVYIEDLTFTHSFENDSQALATLLTTDNTVTFTVTSIRKFNQTARTVNQPVSVNKSGLVSATSPLFDLYSVRDLDKVGSNYEDALWILEHSYPTISLDRTLELAGVNKDTLKTEIINLQKGLSNDLFLRRLIADGSLGYGQSQKDSISDDEIDDYIESYVYGTIQYAVWYVNNAKFEISETEQVTLGDRILNAPELNKIYQYYIKEKGKHSGYGNPTYLSSKINVDGDDNFTTTDSGYRFGPYKVSYSALSGSNVNISLKDQLDGVKIVNKDGTVIADVENGGEYYIEISKKAKLGSVVVNLEADVTTFSPSSNRGRIYSPNAGLYQNVITGGKYVDGKLSGTHTLTVNAKTGVENVAVLLMVTLVAFSLGYLVLSYKNKPVELS